MADGVLLDRALRFLASGPATAAALIAHVCQLPGAPPTVADHMARALFDRHPGFVRGGDGTWRLVTMTQGARGERGVEPAHRVGVATRRAGRGTATRVQAGTREHEVAPRDALGVHAPAVATPLDDLSYVVVDVETTGTSPWRGDRVTEVAAVTVRGGEVVRVFESLVNPQRSIPPFISALTHITWDLVRDAPTFSAIAPQVANELAGNLFVAHNAAFDWRFVSFELERAAAGRLVGERLCTVRLARALLPQVRRRSLDSLAHYFGIGNTARHRAGGDAMATAKVLIRLLQEARGRGCETLEDLRGMGRTMRPRRRRRSALPVWGDGGEPA